jgi:hypothetical protein
MFTLHLYFLRLFERFQIKQLDEHFFLQKYFSMNTDIDLRAIAVDLNSCPTIETQPVSTDMRFETTDFSKYLRKIAGINTPSIPCAVICIAFDLIFTLITLVIGGSNISACPAEPRIPVYLVVSGTANFVSIFFTIVASVLHIKEKDKSMTGFFCVTFSAVIIIILQLFNFIWLIFGTVWVFTVFSQVQYTEMNKANYCQGNTYQYTIVSVILQYIIPIVMCCCKNLPLRK